MAPLSDIPPASTANIGEGGRTKTKWVSLLLLLLQFLPPKPYRVKKKYCKRQELAGFFLFYLRGKWYVPITRKVETVLIRGASSPVGLTLTSIFGRRGGEGAFSNRQRGRRRKGRRRRDLARDQNRIANERVWGKKENTITRRGIVPQNKEKKGNSCIVFREKREFSFPFSQEKSVLPHSSFSFRRGGEGAKVSKMPPAVSPLPFFSWNEIPPTLHKFLQVFFVNLWQSYRSDKKANESKIGESLPSPPETSHLSFRKGGKGGHGTDVK